MTDHSSKPTNAMAITATPGGPVCVTFPTDPKVGAADIAAMAAAMIEDLQRLAEPPVAVVKASAPAKPETPGAAGFAALMAPTRLGG